MSRPSDGAIHATPVPPVALNAITESLVGSNVDVQGTIASINPPREGSKAPVKIGLADETGAFELVIWPNTFGDIKAHNPLGTGSVIHATVRVIKYKDQLQLQVQNATDLQVVSQPAAITNAPSAPVAPAAPASPVPVDANGLTALASITRDLLGKEVTVKATISEIREPQSERAPYLVTLTQEKTQIPMVFWKALSDQVKDKVRVGNVVEVHVTVTEYRGTLEVKLGKAEDIKVVTPAP
jgi:DNA/RNA endonuclease YhcR with UshA esterase domain